ncbi:MAG TPA: PIN-like domain-containing protein [Ktedonobacteraceae bacterium]|nr:PIN-like domain-containing protein [Ktedonobacteraceae bacterium]
MREEFQAYYTPTEQEFAHMWQEGTFAFDANMLLNVYRYSAPTREKLFQILKRLEGRVWLPHQAALEYQKDRLTVISHQFRVFEATVAQLRRALEELKNREGYAHPFIDTGPLTKSINQAIKKATALQQQAQTRYAALLHFDDLREQLTECFTDNIGAPYAQERIEEICREGAQRYKRRIPPGFKDQGKKETKQKESDKEAAEQQEANSEHIRQYGDLILWFQLIDYAKAQHKPLIFVTDDVKEDWWLKHEGRTIGPRPELREEMARQANTPFYMYSGLQFIEYAQKYLGVPVQQEVLDEVRIIQQQAGTVEGYVRTLYNLDVPSESSPYSLWQQLYAPPLETQGWKSPYTVHLVPASIWPSLEPSQAPQLFQWPLSSQSEGSILFIPPGALSRRRGSQQEDEPTQSVTSETNASPDQGAIDEGEDQG